MAVAALDLDGRADLAVELGVAVHVLDEVAIDAVHPLLQVDVELVDRDPIAPRLGAIERGLLGRGGIAGAIALLQLGGQPHGRHQRRGRLVGHGLAAVVEQLPVPILLEHGAEDPAVAVEVGELRVPRLRVQLGDPFQKRRVGPVPPRRRLVRIRHHRAGEFLGGGVFLSRRVHQLAVGLLVPPHVAGV